MITARSWGFEDLVCPWGKRVVYTAQSRSPLHVHDGREEVVLVTEGLAWIESGKDERSLSGVWADLNDRVMVSAGLLHRITAMRDTCLIEFSPNALAESKEIVSGGKVGDAEFRALLAEFYRHENRNIIINVDEAMVVANSLRAEGRTIGMCNGCFDLMHLGHVELIHQAKQRCEVLFVAVNSDKSIAALKPGRPFVGQMGRTGLVAAMRDADYVVLAENRTCVDILKAVRPNVYVTTVESGMSGIEAKEASGMGIAVQVVDMIPGFNTSKIASAVASKAK